MPRIWNRALFNVLKQSSIFHSSTTIRFSSTRFVESATVNVNRKFASSNNVCPTTKNTPACWKCGVSVKLDKHLFCKACDVVQKPDQNEDFFKILLQKRSFDINPADLTKKFRLLQMQLHPDKFSQKTEDEKLISACYSSLVNQAYKTLLSPVERGLYLLQLEGHPLHEGEVTKDPEFFQGIMDINEELDSVQTKDDLEKIRQANLMKLNNLLKEVSLEFKNRNWESARQLMAQIKFYDNIQGKIKELEQHLEIESV